MFPWNSPARPSRIGWQSLRWISYSWSVLLVALGCVFVAGTALGQSSSPALRLKFALPAGTRLQYRFVAANGNATPTHPLTPKADNTLLLPIPQGFASPTAQLEVQNVAQGKFAHYPVKVSRTTTTTLENFPRSEFWKPGVQDASAVTLRWQAWLRRSRQHPELVAPSAPNVLHNGDFQNGQAGWVVDNHPPANAMLRIVDTANPLPNSKGKVAHITVLRLGELNWHNQLHQVGLDLKDGEVYTLSFWAKAGRERPIAVYTSVDGLALDGVHAAWDDIGIRKDYSLTPDWQPFYGVFVAVKPPKNHGRLAFILGDAEGTIDLANITIRAGIEPALMQPASGETLIAAGDFTSAQTVQVPIKYHDSPVQEMHVTLRDTQKSYGELWVQDSPNGVVQFSNVPIKKDLILTVSVGTQSKEFQRRIEEDQSGRLTEIHLPDGWTGVKTLAAVTAPPPTPPVKPVEEPKSDRLTSLLLGVLGVSLLVVAVLLLVSNNRQRKAVSQPAVGLPASETMAVVAARPASRPLVMVSQQSAAPQLTGTATDTAPLEPGLADGKEPRLIALTGACAGNVFPLNDATMQIGRDVGSTIALALDSSASRRHAMLQISNGEYFLTDNGSSNGTFVNGVRIPTQRPHPLQPGDEIEIGMVRFRFDA